MHGAEGASMLFRLLRRLFGGSPSRAPDGAVLAMVALRDSLPAEALTRALSSCFPDAGPASASDGAVVIQLGGGTLAATEMPMPIPWSDLEGPCETALLWPQAEAAMKRHRCHLLVFTSQPDVVEGHLLLTRAVAALVRASDAVGVYWGGAPLVQSAETFLDGAPRHPGGPPSPPPALTERGKKVTALEY